MVGQASVGRREAKRKEQRREEVAHRALQQEKASVSSGVITEPGQNFN